MLTATSAASPELPAKPHPLSLAKHYSLYLWLILGATLVLRAIAMWLIPLTDTTEARYGEIARKMLETGNWVTPLHDYGVPFWAKPPLSTWLSAISMQLFGINEFAARLPSLLLSLAVLTLVYQWLRQYSALLRQLTLVVLATSLLFCASAGIVMTDLSLMLATTIAMISFWQAMQPNARRHWGYLFFASLALGLLAKGPLVFVLAGLPTACWVLVNRQWRDLWQRLPWLTGSLVTLLLAGPWYWLAESRTPGFLHYFIVGEHIERFLVSGWKGDMFGNPHAKPLGSIWGLYLGGLMPWPLLAAWLAFRHKQSLNWRAPLKNPWLNYLLCWAILPVLFFTFARNILSPYVLPAMPACAILLAEFILHFNKQRGELNQRNVILLSLLTPVFAVICLGLFCLAPEVVGKRSEKDMVALYQQLRPTADSQLIYYNQRLYSSEFYSAGKARAVYEAGDLQKLLTNTTRDFVVISKKYIDANTQQWLDQHFTPISGHHQILLYRECAGPCQTSTPPVGKF